MWKKASLNEYVFFLGIFYFISFWLPHIWNEYFNILDAFR